MLAKVINALEKLGSLMHVETVVSTPQGDISLVITRSDSGTYDMELVAPSGATAEFEMRGNLRTLPAGTHRWTFAL